MKRAIVLSLALLAGCAADGSNTNTVVGSAAGAAAGSAVGYNMGGRDGATVGAAIGAAVGAAIGSEQDAARQQTVSSPASRDDARGGDDRQSDDGHYRKVSRRDGNEHDRRRDRRSDDREDD